MSHAKSLMASFFSGFRPPPRLSLAEWAEANVRLPDGLAAVSGPIQLYPFQREMADAMSDPDLPFVTVLKSARIGYSTLLVSAVGSFVVNEPSPILFVQPTEADCRDFVVSDLEPVFAASPALAGTIEADTDDTGRSTMLSRRFPGGYLKIVAAKAPRNLRRHTARVAIVDELDGMDVTAEGPVLQLVRRRTDSFADRKIICGSTPVFEATSPTIASYMESDQRIYEVPCPHCGDFHEVKWADIRWPEGAPDAAYWACPSCGGVMEETGKNDMVAQGRWRATRPEVTNHAGFKLNSLISPVPNARWGILAREFVSCKGDATRLQVFANTILGEGWKEDGNDLDRDLLNPEAFGLKSIPECVIAITAGVDVQDDRLEITFTGWAENGAAYVLGHDIIWQPYDSDGAWLDLDDLLKTRWPHPYGGTIGVDAACVDSSSGLHMAHVYKFCFPRYRRGIFAIKGVAGNRPPIEASKTRTQGGRLWIVGTDTIKSTLFQRVTSGSMIHFSSDLPESWFDQFAGERLVIRYHKGQPVRRFERLTGARVEALDCTVYAYAAWRMIEGRNWERRKEELRADAPAQPKPARPRVVQSAWMNS